jgi:drug/metabolite transporter (DMT)-like permease
MKLTDKNSAIIILCAAASPLLLCLVLFLFGVSDTALLAAIYSVFGLIFVLAVGWVLTFAAKKSGNPLLWTTVGYVAPAMLMNLAILGISFGSN